MVKIGCDWCRKDIKGRPDRYASHHFCLNDDCRHKYRRFIEGRVQLERRGDRDLLSAPAGAGSRRPSLELIGGI
jgi:hypothetical protein